MRAPLLIFILLGCGSVENNTPIIDAPSTDAPSTDAPTTSPTQDCPTYCTNIQANCKDTNAQFGGANAADATAHCTAACATWTKGMASDMTGATLGCHIYHAGAPAMTDPVTHCPHAGPGGDKVDAAGTCGDACTNFCTIEIGACGLKPASATGQYTDTAACVSACGAFDKTHPYKIDPSVMPFRTPGGDSLACRLYHATNAAIAGAAAVHCPHTAATPTGPCSGTATTP